jgi:hypothetical protein
MIRLAWRQFRMQAAIAFGALVVIAVALVATRPQLVHLYKIHDTNLLLNKYSDLQLLSSVLLVVPALIGIFWGAPLLARELETGTFRLAWTQSITRTRWLATKLAVVGLASVAVAGLLSLLVTWWFSPIDRVRMDRLSPLLFGERGITPLGYAAFAFAVGVTVGLLLRRTVPAMAAALALFVAARLAGTYWLRPHLIPPIHATVPLSAVNIAGGTLPPGNGPLTLFVTIPGAWDLSPNSQVVNAAGKVVYGLGKLAGRGPQAGPQAFRAALAKLNLRVAVTYEPASRYWPLQAYETAVFVGVTLVLAGFCFGWVRRRLS